MKTFLNNKWLLLLLRILVGGIFIYAGAIKISDPQSFADSIASFQLAPPQLINLIALGLPVFEVVAGFMILFAIFLRPSSFSVLVMTAIFTLALAQALIRGLQVDCGCFGSGEPSVLKTWMTLGRDLVLFTVVGMIYWSAVSRTRQSIR